MRKVKNRRAFRILVFLLTQIAAILASVVTVILVTKG